MNKIIELPSDTSSKIAAGEVIERPASIVRELLDNAIDAKATHIKLHLKEGGKGGITITDDGEGMSSDDLSICSLHHTTSKITKFEDLFTLETLGFRGEALASIASIARLQIYTRKKKNDVGFYLSVSGGKILPVTGASSEIGTRVIVSELFFNVPARLKFLKSGGYELFLIKNEILFKALAFSNISFSLFNNEKLLFATKGTGNVPEVISSVFGKRETGQLKELEHSSEGLTLQGYIGDPSFFSGKRDLEYFFVNRRYIPSRLFYHALDRAYSAFLSKGRYPAVILFLEIDPKEADINVHPAKREVSFRDSQKVYDLVCQSIKKKLSQYQENLYKTPGHFINLEHSKSENPFIPDIFPSSAPSHTIGIKDVLTSFQSRFQTDHFTEDSTIIEMSGLDNFHYKIAGYFFNNYILIENSEEILIIDQHAAHERILFENLKSKWEINNSSFELLVPFLFESSRPISDFKAFGDLLGKIGFYLEEYGANSLLVRKIPEFLAEKNLEGLLVKIIENEISIFDGAEINETTVEKLKTELLSTIACRNAYKAGDSINTLEMKELAGQILTHGWLNCPHGRPVIFKLPKKEIETWFQRRK